MKAIKKFPVRPILGRVIIEIEEQGEEISEYGIIETLDSDRAASKNEGKNRVGVVVAFDEGFYSSARNKDHLDGLGAPREEQCAPNVKMGDRVFFAVSWAGESFYYEGKKYHVLEGEDAAAVILPCVKVEATTR